MASTTDTLTRGELERQLVAAVEAYPCEKTRFYKLVASGRCPDKILRRYAQSTFLSAKLFCASLAEMIEKAPDPEARLILLENLLEEEGIVLRSDKGLVVRPEQRHSALALRFVEACGGDGAGDDAARPGLNTIGPGRSLLAEGRWLEAVAFLLIGQELKFADASAKLFDVLRKHGFSESEILFFAIHGEADLEHGQQALDLVLDRAKTSAEQQAAIAAAKGGAEHWFQLHGGNGSA